MLTDEHWSKLQAMMLEASIYGKPNATILGNAVRADWSIENNLHWVLDVVFKEDYVVRVKSTPLKIWLYYVIWHLIYSRKKTRVNAVLKTNDSKQDGMKLSCSLS